MNTQIINSASDLYQLVGHLKVECDKNGLTELATPLDDALNLGSSGLEILGAIRQTFVKNRITIQRLLGPSGKAQIERVINFVDTAFGR
jgi:hypothetical protein